MIQNELKRAKSKFFTDFFFHSKNELNENYKNSLGNLGSYFYLQLFFIIK
jgi:hypothetical protein